MDGEESDDDVIDIIDIDNSNNEMETLVTTVSTNQLIPIETRIKVERIKRLENWRQ